MQALRYVQARMNIVAQKIKIFAIYMHVNFNTHSNNPSLAHRQGNEDQRTKASFSSDDLGAFTASAPYLVFRSMHYLGPCSVFMSHLSFIPAEFKLDRRAPFDILVPAANITSALIEHTIWDVAAGVQREREGRRGE